MIRRLLALTLVLAATPVAAATAPDADAYGAWRAARAEAGAYAVLADAPGAGLVSPLAPAVRRTADQVPEGWLAQRAIEREWGPSEDSLYVVIEQPGWRSEGLVFVLSGVVPGAGQYYVGEGSAWFYLAVEAAGWAGRTMSGRRARELRDEAAAFVGDPNDPAAGWSFARYEAASGGSASVLEALWVGDREAYYQALASDPTYRAGFIGPNPTNSSDAYRGLRDDSQARFRNQRLYSALLWLNHAVSAFDALRAARLHNLPIRRNIELQLGGRLKRGQPDLRATLVRRF
ncbi:MAG: hypothetical protein ACKO3S_07395 [bacterium]